ncbi:nucleoside phosphorylase domain-containing protein [Crucibulum laeve]|uniref:Nucleoside phosphorylase domain-containing protein n=1 Tax=Crucibulum laeve TaxID=68775 RepID=A0A5C3LN32_9AGAR|nr:nucleoside phosphorylase domain-containing protein [Crucibulum laeve]
MKDTLTDANFPRTADQRVYHLGLRPGEVANRIVTVGSPSRAKTIAKSLDAKPELFELSSERGFLTITGRYKNVPISIVSIGMGSPNMDFFIREVRESVSGDMAIVRLGSCGSLIDLPVGTIVVPQACVAVNRNFDYDFTYPENNGNEPAYRISKPVAADQELHDEVHKALEGAKPAGSKTTILAGIVNASADSFYSSQGRQTSFPDANADLIEHLKASTKDLATLEMETHHLYHLAACWDGRARVAKEAPAPLTTGPVSPVTSRQSSPQQSTTNTQVVSPHSVIRAAGAQMIFASRTSQDFITPEEVDALEHWAGKGVLDALVNLYIPAERLHANQGSVWELA